MSFSIRAIIAAVAAPDHRISCTKHVWRVLMTELAARGEGTHESGAFLLGSVEGGRRRITAAVYYDDLDPHAYESGVVTLDGAVYGALWSRCRNLGLQVVADVHTHPGLGRQSPTDARNPMVMQEGHVAIIVPNYARNAAERAVGVYEYRGNHEWTGGEGNARRLLYVGRWG